LPALKNGTVFSCTETVLPVRGLLPNAGVTPLHREGVEITQLHTLAASQVGGDLVEYRHNDEFRIRYP
jgi:hypothetical protein